MVWPAGAAGGKLLMGQSKYFSFTGKSGMFGTGPG